jgi:hypothetical protein
LFRKEDDEDEFDRFNAGDGFDDWIDDDTNEFGVQERKAAEKEARQYRMPSEFGGDSFVSKGKRKAECESSTRLRFPANELTDVYLQRTDQQVSRKDKPLSNPERLRVEKRNVISVRPASVCLLVWTLL